VTPQEEDLESTRRHTKRNPDSECTLVYSNSEKCRNIVTSKNILPKRELNNIIILYLIRPYCSFVKFRPIVP
jgi:hypothetical protein